ncbi:unnamed protein product [Cuscuta europaea]|uniref:Retrovirus-related Pol polyprotein from transposon TNT 1-94 n=1 Tax=Cuscuta europaea TaxID=41803 RepID=A0A9P0ZLN6_CUSEU|nr:unnamed protein product [Cuscuta europaea]
MASPKFHPALAVSNIKNFITITLDLETVEYSSWTELFKITARAYQVIDHIIPPSPTTPVATPPHLTIEQRLAQEAADIEARSLWDRLDAIVLQWIYGTISHDLLHTIIEPDSTAHHAWERLQDIFQDNKNSRATYLENQFSNTRLDQFPNIAAYCKTLKVLADQLTNVDSPVSNQRLVFRMVNGLPEQYDTVASLIPQADPVPLFSKARSMLILEESRKHQQVTPPAALLHTADPPSPSPRPARTDNRGARPRGRVSSNRGGRQRSNPRPEGFRQHYATPYPGQWPPNHYAYWPQGSPWVAPPCPYPSVPWQTPAAATSTPTAGILGPRPQQDHYVAAPPTPTDLQAAIVTPRPRRPRGSYF